MHYIQDWWSKRMLLTHLETSLDYNYHIAQCKGIEDILGLWIPDPRFFVVELGLRIPDSLNCIPDSKAQGRDPFNQTFRKFRSKTQWIGSVQPEKFRKNGSTFWGGPLFSVGPVWILVEWIAPQDSRFSRIPDSTSETFPDSGNQIPSYGENQNRKRFACP